jgi:hypothetical protein
MGSAGSSMGLIDRLAAFLLFFNSLTQAGNMTASVVL